MGNLRKQVSSFALGDLRLFILPLLCVLLYLPSLNHNFILDDRWLVVENPYIKSWKYLPQMLTEDLWNIWDRHNYWRPVLSISFALDFSLWGLNAFGFHLTSALLHAINAVLFYFLAEKFQNRSSALLAALLFALHPIQAQAVNLITSRGELLAAFFTLLSIQALFSGKTFFSLLLMIPALLSKETSMVLPAVLLASGFITRDKRWATKTALALMVLAIYLLVRFSLGFTFSLPQSVFSYNAPLPARILLAFKVLALYFLALVNPSQVPHPFWSVEVPTSFSDAYVILGIGVLGLLLGAIFWNWRKNPALALGLAWFVIYFVPISNLKQLNQPMAEHWLYVPMTGLCLSFGAALDALLTRLSSKALLKEGLVAAVGIFLVLGAIATGEKIGIYHDDEFLWLAVVHANPQLARAYSILGTIFLSRQDIPRAKEFYTKALSLDPNEFIANYRMGFLLYQAGQRDQAQSFLRRVVRSEPSPLYAILTVAHAWEMLGDQQKALSYYQKARAIDPNSSRIQEKIAALSSPRPHPEPER